MNPPLVFPRYLEITLVHNVFKADIYCTPSSNNDVNDNDTKNNSDATMIITIIYAYEYRGSHWANDARPVCVINHTFITRIAYNSSVYSTPTAIFIHSVTSIVLLRLCKILNQIIQTTIKITICNSKVTINDSSCNI